MLRRATVAAALALALFAATADAASLVGQWHLNDTVNMQAADSSGHALNATSTFNFNPGPGKFGTAINSAGFYKTLGANNAPTALDRLTLLAWIKVSSTPPDVQYIAGRGNDGTTCLGGSYALYSGHSDGSPSHPGLRFYIRPAATGNVGIFSPQTPDAAVYDNQWHLVAGTFDGSRVRMYVDGVQQGTGTPVPAGAKPNYSLPNQTNDTFYFDGYNVPACEHGPGTSWPGPIDEIRLYDCALTAKDLTLLAAAPTGGAPPVAVPPGACGASNPPAGGPGPGGPTADKRTVRDLVLCGRRDISLVRADQRGRKVALSGLVSTRLAGKKVDLAVTYGGKTRKLKSVTPKADGQFSASVKGPPRRFVTKARYRAAVGKTKSVALKLPQSLASTSIKASGDTIVLRGKVKKSLLGKRNKIVIRRLLCGKLEEVATTRPAKSGAYVARFKAPLGAAAALYRAEDKLLARPKSKRYVKQFARAIGIALTGQSG